jgi:hypothetical protein
LNPPTQKTIFFSLKTLCIALLWFAIPCNGLMILRQNEQNDPNQKQILSILLILSATRGLTTAICQRTTNIGHLTMLTNEKGR